ncbi:1-acyl-sn-glycerol-3-phosphate acyltransferase [Fulvivirga imtechensis AK7]|uniref:1-acyl-sn-glycerol-3-phosphate acyltransferase n=1 Tax=Fulvivirga imtechensis AK7 TaxID=1237149 RepID=L8JN23_9BACT|nr:lysophospholipid acyltransferase family protein [Fulvivirga imtechensis]ELR68747.1 1-acyl-sn-glycerol-3-phosphate acyltransferase [Fulvivirga imtechensis AK7]
MRLLKKIISKIYLVWVLLVFNVFMLIFLPIIVLPILLGEKYGNVTYFGLYLWSWVFSRLTFIGYKIEGRENVDKRKSYIYTSNHTSFLDVPGLRLGIPTQFRPLAKKELLKIPGFGLIVRVATIVVDRSNNESRKRSVKRLKQALDSGISILIFPEGTQNRTDQPLQPFYDGAFRIAIETNTPIIPIVVINAGNLMPPSKLDIKPGRIKVIFGQEVAVEGYGLSDLPFLKEKVFNAMKDIVERESGDKYLK